MSEINPNNGAEVTPDQPVSTVTAQPAAAPAKKGSALKIILIILLVVVGLGVVALGGVAYVGWRFAHSIKVNSASSSTAANLGVDIYPGAEAQNGGVSMNLGGTSMNSGVFTTADSKDQVVAFYKDKLGSDANTTNYATTASLSLNKGQESWVITIVPGDSQSAGKTKISIVHTKKG